MPIDEPINGLDPQGIVEIRNMLLDLNKRKDITIIISSHILEELYNYGGYTAANAAEFSDMMAQRMGWSSYGDKQYVRNNGDIYGYIESGIIPKFSLCSDGVMVQYPWTVPGWKFCTCSRRYYFL